MESSVEKPRNNAERVPNTRGSLSELQKEIQKYREPKDYLLLRDLSWQMKEMPYEKFTSKARKEQLKTLKAHVEERIDELRKQAEAGAITSDDQVLQNFSAASNRMQSAIEDRGTLVETGNIALTTAQGIGAFAAASALATPLLGPTGGFIAASLAGAGVAGATQFAGKIGRPLGLSERNTRTAIRAASLIPLLPFLATGTAATFLVPSLILGSGFYALNRWRSRG